MFLLVVSTFQVTAAERARVPSLHELNALPFDARSGELGRMVERLDQGQQEQFFQIVLVAEFLKNDPLASATFEVEYNPDTRCIIWWSTGVPRGSLKVRFLGDQEILAICKTFYRYVADQTNASKRELRSVVPLQRGEALTRKVLSQKMCNLLHSAGLME